MSTKNLLVELFVEELPPKALKKLGEAFATALADSLKNSGLATAASQITDYATPRRLAVHMTGVLAVAPERAVSTKLMPASVGLDADGKATPALLKKLAALGADADSVPKLRREHDGKTEALFHDSRVAGATLAEGLQKALDAAIAALPIPKVMSYQLHERCAQPGWSTVHFVRPAHGLVALHGSDIVPVSALGLAAGRTTHGHRFEAASDPIALADADAYATALREKGAVIASFAERRAEIARQLKEVAQQAGNDLHPIDDDALLDEVTALVELPNVLAGQFEPEFLAVPQECLILTMKANQKYFPLLDQAGRLTNRFLIVSNIRPADASAVIEGNERVVRPRLADAKFFFDQDRKKTLESRVSGLDMSFTTTSSARRVSARSASRPLPTPSPGSSTAASRNRANKPPALPRPICSPTWSANSPSCKASWAATTRCMTVSRQKLPTPSKTITSRASPATSCRVDESARSSRWPTSWKHSPACSASATCRPATRTHSPCAGTPWA